MAVTCPKCQTVNDAATGAPNESCPQCGVIYARAAVAQAQRRVAESTRVSVPAKAHDGPGALERLCWWVVVAGCVLALVQLGITFGAESAPQQAAGAGLALGFAAVPYCLARAIQQLSR
jgi:hypothetical protein